MHLRTYRLLSSLLLCAGLVLGTSIGCSGDDPGGGDKNQNDQEADAGPDTSTEDAGPDATGPDADDAGPDADAGEALGAFHLQISDLQGRPIEGASVSLPGAVTQSDAQGRVALDGLQPGRLVAGIQADGYAESTAVVDVVADLTIHDTVRLLETGAPIAFDAATKSTLYKGHVRVDIPADSLVDPSGQAYTGQATATIAPLNPSTEQLAAMPGPLMGVLEGDTDPTPMESIFMADIVLEGDSGQRLQVADDASLTLEFVLPDDLQDDYQLGDEIEGYWYDTDNGVWIQEGKGQIIDSTYAPGKLAWSFEAAHLTWWNCDAPWYDKNCVTVEVIDTETGAPIEGATVSANGITYNGSTYGVSGTDGEACVNFKLDADVGLEVTAPNGYTAVGGSVQLSGSTTAATCEGDGDGQCDHLVIEMAPPTCLNGTVVDDAGDPIEGVSVFGFGTSQAATATTDANGAYCLSVPQGADITVLAEYLDGQQWMTATTDITSSSMAASCGGDACTEVDTLTPKPSETGCVSGKAAYYDTNQDIQPAPATNVYIFRDNEASNDTVRVDCDLPPEQWGTLVTSGTTDGDGEFCLQVPATSQKLRAVVGRCGEFARECIGFGPTFEVTQAATCGDGDCRELVEPLYLNECGTGP